MTSAASQATGTAPRTELDGPGRRRPVDVTIGLRGFTLAGRLTRPGTDSGPVVIVVGPGPVDTAAPDDAFTSRLVAAGFGVLRVELRAPDQEPTDEAVDLELDAVRLLAVTRWTRAHATCGGRIGYLGTGHGATVAVLAAGDDPSVAALVSCDGQPDRAGDVLRRLSAPTLLIVTDANAPTRRRNQLAARALRCEHELVVVHSSTQPTWDEASVDAAARRASAWFRRQIGLPAANRDAS